MIENKKAYLAIHYANYGGKKEPWHKGKDIQCTLFWDEKDAYRWSEGVLPVVELTNYKEIFKGLEMKVEITESEFNQILNEVVGTHQAGSIICDALKKRLFK